MILFWLLLSALLVVLPHVPRLPLWVTLFAACLGAAHLLMQRAGHGMSRWLVIGLTLTGASGVFLYYHTLLGRDAGVALYSQSPEAPKSGAYAPHPYPDTSGAGVGEKPSGSGERGRVVDADYEESS